jgi:hypothetical protein
LAAKRNRPVEALKEAAANRQVRRREGKYKSVNQLKSFSY